MVGSDTASTFSPAKIELGDQKYHANIRDVGGSVSNQGTYIPKMVARFYALH
jgi:hypothetical protein